MMARLLIVFLLVAVLAGNTLANIPAIISALTGGGARLDIPVDFRPPSSYYVAPPSRQFSFNYGKY